ncbi:MAG: DUF4190 domain-containing protein [Phycisphaerales bacterium]|nr:DUF4190 domain-containing protein [Phycisphaerales bacterium]
MMTDAMPREPSRGMSPWAIAAALSCLSLCFLPLSPVLGWRALVDIRARPERTGRFVAWASIVFGILALTVMIYGGFWWYSNVRSMFLRGPEPALRKGFAGDVRGFVDGFDFEPSSNISEITAAHFLNELSTRYGALQSMAQDADAQSDVPFDERSQTMVLMYRLTFERADVLAEAELILRDPTRGWVRKWRRLVVRDPERGDLVFPAVTAESTDVQ